MKLINAIEDFDNCRSNQLSAEQKIKWISELDHKIFCEYLQVRGEESFSGYSSLTPCETVLKAPEEYSEIYCLYLNMKLDYLNGEITRFNNSTQLFNRLYKEMGDAINRKIKIPQNTKIKVGDLYV